LKEGELLLNGKVIGEFVCDKVVEFENSIYDEALRETVTKSCVSMYDLLVYIGKKDYGYGWHISDLVIYDEPRELSEFRKPEMPTGLRYEDDAIKRPPQSWFYVEEKI
jgi:predicted transcriptional regulator